MRDRLTEMIQNSVGGCAKHWAEIIADHLLANGVIVPPVKVGDVVFYLENSEIKQGPVFDISIHKDCVLFHTRTRFCLEERQLFFTKEEAEQALARKKGGE